MPKYMILIESTINGKKEKTQGIVDAKKLSDAYQMLQNDVYKKLDSKQKKAVSFEKLGHKRLRIEQPHLSNNQKAKARRELKKAEEEKKNDLNRSN